ncbi:MAG: hypothetical protein K2N44_08100 [Lachnospiraceae bacterium]|nr:hypothetical protein [Lachnospiraceae bacterium]
MMTKFLEQIKPLYNVDVLQGYTEADIELLYHRFGTLPKILEEYYRAAGRTEAFHDVNQDFWVLPEDYGMGECLQQTQYLILLVENQSVCHAGIRREDLSLPDPPVYCTDNNENWILCAPSTSAFLMAALAYEAVSGFEYSSEEFYWLTKEDVEFIKNRLTKFPYELISWIGGMKVTLYQNESDNMVAVMECGDDDFEMLYGAASEASYDRLKMILEGIGEPM